MLDGLTANKCVDLPPTGRAISNDIDIMLACPNWQRSSPQKRKVVGSSPTVSTKLVENPAANYLCRVFAFNVDLCYGCFI